MPVSAAKRPTGRGSVSSFTTRCFHFLQYLVHNHAQLQKSHRIECLQVNIVCFMYLHFLLWSGIGNEPVQCFLNVFMNTTCFKFNSVCLSLCEKYLKQHQPHSVHIVSSSKSKNSPDFIAICITELDNISSLLVSICCDVRDGDSVSWSSLLEKAMVLIEIVLIRKHGWINIITF